MAEEKKTLRVVVSTITCALEARLKTNYMPRVWVRKDAFIHDFLRSQPIYEDIEDRIDFYEDDTRGDLNSDEARLAKVANGTHIYVYIRSNILPTICQVLVF